MPWGLGALGPQAKARSAIGGLNAWNSKAGSMMLGGLMQTGVTFAPGVLKPQFSRIDRAILLKGLS